MFFRLDVFVIDRFSFLSNFFLWKFFFSLTQHIYGLIYMYVYTSNVVNLPFVITIQICTMPKYILFLYLPHIIHIFVMYYSLFLWGLHFVVNLNFLWKDNNWDLYMRIKTKLYLFDWKYFPNIDYDLLQKKISAIKKNDMRYFCYILN